MAPHRTPFLALVEEKERITIPALPGNEWIFDAKDAFFFIDKEFETLRDASENPETDLVEIETYDTRESAKFVEMFTSIAYDLDLLCFTQGQLVWLVRNRKEWLAKGHSPKHFLFRNGDQYFVAIVLVDTNMMPNVAVDPLGTKTVWNAELPLQVVVPRQ